MMNGKIPRAIGLIVLVFVLVLIFHLLSIVEGFTLGDVPHNKPWPQESIPPPRPTDFSVDTNN